MAPGVATKVIAAICALAAFTVAILAGLFADNPAATVLLRALGALVVGQVVGLIVGAIGERVVGEGIKTYQKNHPTPDGRSAAVSSTDSSGKSRDSAIAA